MMKPGGVMVFSSPGREKLPSTLGFARLLSCKAGGGSRTRAGLASSGTARSSPLFVSRSRSVGRSTSAATAAASGEEEPSSPTVTCIGQVKMRNKCSAKKKVRSKSFVIPCRCLDKLLLCGLFGGRRRPKGGGSGEGGRRSVWWRWAGVRSGGSSGYQQQKPDRFWPPPQPPVFVGAGEVPDREEEIDYKNKDQKEVAQEDDARVSVPSAIATPPKNALLLMRCRSAPHNRPSSLSNARFEVSSLPDPVLPEDVRQGKAQQQQRREERRSSGGEELVQEAEAVTGTEEDEDGGSEESRRPLVLSRSNSVPARRAAVPEASNCLWTSGSWPRRSGQAHE
ncbi:hypothetical protein B296_00032715 [Ensete ventricosum]|uniref:Uncharacterized protein n=1 Tax=Ensete ventricosum TaxID=4639 RepID=A0A426X5P8_ENSVE|nr:hypothetical protein B296_00032715 [Ensete ventricosum]